MLVRPLPGASRLLFALAALVLAGCHKLGNGSAAAAGAKKPLFVDYALRTDLHLGTAFIGDLLHRDLDGDGLEDLAESNFGTRFLTIARGESDGSFTTLHQLRTLGHAFRLASGDFNGDGRIDLAVACGDWIDGAERGVQVFLQDPTPLEFAAPVTLTLDSDPKDVCVLPLASGADELFVAMRDQERVLRLVLEEGELVENGALDSSAVGIGHPVSLAAIDLGADGTMDLAVGEDNLGLDRVLVYRNSGSGFGPAEVVLQPAATPIVDNTGDMDGNGFDDLAVAQLDGEAVFLLAGDAAGLSQAFALDFGGATTSALFADVNGDGLADAIGTVFLQESVQVRLASAPFEWGAPTHYNVGIGPRAIGVLTLPGDSEPDLLCANAQDLSLLFGLGNGRFRAATGVSTGPEQPIFVEAADLDGDHDLDAVVITREQQTLVFFENQGGVLVRARVLDLQPTKKDDTGYLALGDLDADGDVDAAVTVTEKGEVRIYRNQGGAGSFVEPAARDVIHLGGGPLGIDSGDLNGDGRRDLVVGNLESRSLHVLLGEDGGGLFVREPIALPFASLAVRCAELDGDGKIDLVATGRGSTGELVAVFAGDGAGGFELRASEALPGASGNLVLADIDEDGRRDVVVGQVELLGSELFLLQNRGAFQFEPDSLRVGDGPGTPLVADFDADGHLDLSVLSTGGKLLYSRGDGRGGFVSVTRRTDDLTVPDLCVAGTLADIDKDGLAEMLMVSPAAPFLWVAENLSQELAEP